MGITSSNPSARMLKGVRSVNKEGKIIQSVLPKDIANNRDLVADACVTGRSKRSFFDLEFAPLGD